MDGRAQALWNTCTAQDVSQIAGVQARSVTGARTMIRERRGGFGLSDDRMPRDHAAARRWLALAVILSVALAGALLGQMSVVRNDMSRPVPPGPLDHMLQ